jgi:T4 RnlA family RNA ligase
MEKLLKVDMEVLNDLVEHNLIIKSKHPEHDIWILNYSPKATYHKIWNDYTLSARGLVIDAFGNILARPFAKFFNIEEITEENLPNGVEFEVFDKVDGSLGILFNYLDEWILASRGSFISDQAKMGWNMLNKDYLKILNKKFTYLFEIIYPENRIVIDYGGKKELILLGAIETENGVEMFHDDLIARYSEYFSIVKRYDFNGDIKELKNLFENNREGFVVRFLNDFRVKVKFEEYIRLHRIITNVSNKTVWEHLKNSYDFNELIDRVPDEFYDWIKKTIKDLNDQFIVVENNALKEFIRIYHVNKCVERKDFAECAKESEYRSILFNIYSGKSYNDIIWEMIKPEFAKPFSEGYQTD